MSEAKTQTFRDERLAIIATMVAVGLMFSTVIELPTQRLAFHLFGSELSLTLSGPAQLLGILSVLVCAGAHLLATNALKAREPHPLLLGLLESAMHWGLPLLIATLGLLLIQRIPWRGFQIALAVATGLLVSTTLSLQMATLSTRAGRFKWQQVILQALVYITAYGSYTLIFGSRSRSLLSATAVLFVSVMLSLELLRLVDAPSWRIWLHALLVGLVIGELTWCLNYARLDAQAGGIILLMAFYTIAGITQQGLWGRLTPRVLLEYLSILGVGLGVLSLLK